jgi:DNA-binding LytR/AlgR family response regulator
MTSIRVLVIEDESIVSKDIQNSLKKLGYLIAGSASNGEKAIELALSEQPDVILMDIMLKGDMTGIEAAEAIKKQYDVPIIYLTAYADSATLSRAKITEPYGYILKPFKEVDLQTSIEMAIYKHSKHIELLRERDLLHSLVESGTQSPQFFFIKSNSKLIKINKSDIYYIEALKDYVIIYTNDTRYTVHSTMKDIEMKLGLDSFIRVHRSFIIRIDKIASIDYPNLYLEHKDVMIPIGGSYKDELNNRLNLL